jgi:predicted alpha/beta hydrolase
MNIDAGWLPVARDGHRWQVMYAAPASPERLLVWLPALGVPARHYEAFARALAARGIAVVVHEWRGFGASSLRASHDCDWGYRELLGIDIPATCEAAKARFPAMPVTLGGHSLGGQLATCSLALEPDAAQALWLVASGAPYARAFPWAYRLWLPAAYRLLALLARAFGALPGRRIGFGGQEARGVIRDWSRTALSGRYAAPGVGDVEERMRAVDVPVHAVLLSHDWLAPRGSLAYLLGKLGSREQRVRVLDRETLGARPDHFHWMRAPDAVVRALLD